MLRQETGYSGTTVLQHFCTGWQVVTVLSTLSIHCPHPPGNWGHSCSNPRVPETCWAGLRFKGSSSCYCEIKNQQQQVKSQPCQGQGMVGPRIWMNRKFQTFRTSSLWVNHQHCAYISVYTHTYMYMYTCTIYNAHHLPSTHCVPGATLSAFGST